MLLHGVRVPAHQVPVVPDHVGLDPRLPALTISAAARPAFTDAP